MSTRPPEERRERERRVGGRRYRTDIDANEMRRHGPRRVAEDDRRRRSPESPAEPPEDKSPSAQAVASSGENSRDESVPSQADGGVLRRAALEVWTKATALIVGLRDTREIEWLAVGRLDDAVARMQIALMDRRAPSPTDSSPIGSGSVDGPSGESEVGEPGVGNCTSCGERLVWRGRNPQSLRCLNRMCSTNIVDTLRGDSRAVTRMEHEAAADYIETLESELARLRASVERTVGEGGAGVGSQAGGVCDNVGRPVSPHVLAEVQRLFAVVEMEAERRAIACEMGVGEWEGFVAGVVDEVLGRTAPQAGDLLGEAIVELANEADNLRRNHIDNLRALHAATRIQRQVDRLATFRARALHTDGEPEPEATPEGSAGVETRAGFAAYMPAHWRETLTENPRWIVGATRHPDAAEEWERVEIRPLDGPPEDSPREAES